MSSPIQQNESEQDSDRTRVHTLTEKGLQLYREKVDTYLRKFNNLRADLDKLLKQDVPETEKEVHDLRRNIETILQLYSELSMEYVNMLVRYNTEESAYEQSRHCDEKAALGAEVSTRLRAIDSITHSRKPEPVKSHKSVSRTVKSHKSKSLRSHSSHSSTISTMLVQHHAKANAAEAKAQFAVKEAELKKQAAAVEAEHTKQAASLRAEMDIMEAQKEAAAAAAAYQCIKEEIGDSDSEISASLSDTMLNKFFAELDKETDPNLQEGKPMQKMDSVNLQQERQAHVYSASEKGPVFQSPQQTLDNRGFPTTVSAKQFTSPSFHPRIESRLPETGIRVPDNPVLIKQEVSNDMPAATSLSKPQKADALQTLTTPSNFGVSDLSNYLIKRDFLINSGIDNFSDKPEAYQSWKDSFCALKAELKPNAREELDLLMKYLGPESKKCATSIKCANSSNPLAAVQKIWRRLEDRYGSPVLVETALKTRLAKFADIPYKDTKRLYDLADLLAEVQGRMQDPVHQRSLSYFDSSSGMRPIVAKLPGNLQEKWTTRATSYNAKHDVLYPPFSVLVDFVNEMSRIRNDPGFQYSNKEVKDTTPSYSTRKDGIRVKKTAIVSVSNKGEQCMLHEAKHGLNECKTFQKLTLNERKKLLKDYNFCFRCCHSTAHNFKTCQSVIKCATCGRDNHCTALHLDKANFSKTTAKSKMEHGGEKSVVTTCTSVCGEFSGRSCAKTVLVKVYPAGRPDLSMKTYALLDDQSNSTLARAEFFDRMNIPWSAATSYTLTSCAGRRLMSGRRAGNFIVEAVDGSSSLELPIVTECSDIPDEKAEIPTPEIKQFHRHLQGVDILPLDAEAAMLLLIGRDLPEAHHIYDQRTGPKGAPFAQKTILGWVLIGNVCLNNMHPPNNLQVMKTTIGQEGRGSLFEGCELNLTVKVDDGHLFRREPNDNMIGPSVEDKKFLELMNNQFTKSPSGNWMAPLPFREPRSPLPNNRSVALKRASMLQASLHKNHVKQEHFLTFMQRIFDCGHAEPAPPVENGTECWYLPIFGVYHPKKKDKIRVVFDSSSKYEGVSLNSTLMQGPDLLNRLDGVLLRFRKESVAIIADIQQMFFGFLVTEPHRNYLRFFWHRNNDPTKNLAEYRMRVHVFGNAPSPAVATYGLRRCVEDETSPCDDEVRKFVKRNFYVDDGLSSFPNVEKAVSVLKKTQQVLLQSGNLRLHKIASNSDDVMAEFPSSDLAETVEPLDLTRDDLPLHHSLGMGWHLSKDTFTYKPSNEQKPYTKRGLLSTVNGLFDPLGFIAPTVLQGKIIMRDAIAETADWDDPLPQQTLKAWIAWVEELTTLDQIHIPRCILPVSMSECTSKTLHIFCDASEKAIAACAFLRGSTSDDAVHIGFVFGKSKVAPKSGHTIPRLELCACVLAVEVGEMLSRELDIPLHDIQYYSDSTVALGYISNERRRFYVYVSNRVARIHKSSSQSQWNHVPTETNPADQGTRGLSPDQLTHSLWLTGPAFLRDPEHLKLLEDFPLVEPDHDREVYPHVQALKTSAKLILDSSRFGRFSSWRALVHAIRTIRKRIRREVQNVEDLTIPEVENFIVREVQHQFFHKEVSALQNAKKMPTDSPVLSLAPYLDNEGLLRVAGRLKLSDLPVEEKTPLLIPGHSHVAKLLVSHHHEKIHHQGRHLTEGAVRSAGLWITGGKRLVANVIHHCVTCRKLRGKTVTQKMADLPVDRLTPSPPFTYVGVDVFGPWGVTTRRTRGGSADSKRWAVLFTCLYSRAVHIELLEEMSTSSFINAMRRFVAMRGSVSEFRSDRGTNFVGAASELGMKTVCVEDDQMRVYLEENNIVWRFNPPHASHFGGVWERMIGIARRILDAMLLDFKQGRLTHEVLSTFLAEVMAIMNSRPLVPVSTDVDEPFVLSPATLLTQKPPEIVSIFQDIGVKDMYRCQWKMVQVLANTFWKRWKGEYLSSLQPRKKWASSCENIKADDIVLLREKDCTRNEWPIGLVTKAFPSEDGLVRKLQIRVMKNEKICLYVRPVAEVVLLVAA